MSARIPSAGSAELEVDGRRLTLTSLDKVLWPRTGFTKGQLIDYYLRVGPSLVPHVAGRPVTLGRFPDGVARPGFAQTECRGRPEWMATVPLRLRSGEVRRYCLVNDLPSLVWVANLGTIELHPFLASREAPDQPTVVVFDLDPGAAAEIADCHPVALRLREALAEAGLDCVAKTSGARGVHVWVPLAEPHSHDDTTAFARSVARRLAAERPDAVTDSTRDPSRQAKVLVDWAQNRPRRSIVAPYSLRAADWPTVSAPIRWEEVQRAAECAQPLVFTAADALDRLERLGDLFAPALEMGQVLPQVA